MLKEGKSPVFMSKSARKNKELVEQFEELKSSGRIDNYLKKKAKKNLHKDKKKMSHLQNWIGLFVTCIKSTHAISIHEKWKNIIILFSDGQNKWKIIKIRLLS